MTTATKAEKWIGFRQNADRGIVAMFALPSGRVREVPLDTDLAFQAINELARALRYALKEQA